MIIFDIIRIKKFVLNKNKDSCFKSIWFHISILILIFAAVAIYVYTVFSLGEVDLRILNFRFCFYVLISTYSMYLTVCIYYAKTKNRMECMEIEEKMYTYAF